MKKLFVVQLLLLICGVFLILLAIDSAIYDISIFVRGYITFSSWQIVFDFVVDIFTIIFQLLSGAFAIVQFIKLKDEYIDHIVKFGVVMLICGTISLIFSIAAGEFAIQTWKYEIFESIAYIVFPLLYFVLALVLNRVAD